MGASHCNLGHRTQEAAMILIWNKKNEAAPIMRDVKKVKRTCSSTLEADLTALVEGMRQATHLKQVLEELYGCSENTIPVHAITSHRGLYEATHSTAAMGTRRLQDEMTTVRDCMALKEIATLSLVRSEVKTCLCNT